MGRTGKHAEGKAAQRTVVGDVAGMATQEPGRATHEIFQTASGLQGSRGRDDGKDDEHHVDGGLAGRQTEKVHQNESSQHSVDAQTHTANAHSYINEQQYDGQFDKNE